MVKQHFLSFFNLVCSPYFCHREATLEQSLQGMHAAFAHAKQTKQVRLPKITVSDTEFKQVQSEPRSIEYFFFWGLSQQMRSSVTSVT